MSKKKKQRRPIRKKELIFDIFSLVSLIIIGLIYEFRAYYFYNEETKDKVLTDATLNGSILDNNRVTTTGAGLYQDKDGYYFKGDVNNNYVKFGNRLFRVIRINKDNSVKVISYDLVASFMNGNTKYDNGNIRKFLNKTDNKINDTDNSGVYYDTIPNADYFLKTTKYSIDSISNDKVISSDKEYKDYISSLTIDDYIKAGGKNSYLNIVKYFYIIVTKGNNEILSIYDDGTIDAVTSSDTSGVRAVFTFKKNLKLMRGNGTIENPYVIKQGSYINFVDSYVRLGDNIWKVYYDKNRVIKLALNGYYMKDNSFVTSSFSNQDNVFDQDNMYNIGYLLNNEFYSSLYYNNYLINGTHYNGTIGEENSYDYKSIYTNKVYSKVGLLNIFDYNNTLFLDNFYMINSNNENTCYVYRKNGVLEEVGIEDEKLVVPVITMYKGIIRRGRGSIDDPYTV